MKVKEGQTGKKIYKKVEKGQDLRNNIRKTFWIKDGILFGRFRSTSTVKMDMIKRNNIERLSLCKGKEYPTLFSYSNFGYNDKKVREFFINEGCEGMRALAIYVDSNMVKSFFSYFLDTTQFKLPAKIFTNKQEAIEWLKKHRISN